MNTGRFMTKEEIEECLKLYEIGVPVDWLAERYIRNRRVIQYHTKKVKRGYMFKLGRKRVPVEELISSHGITLMSL